MSLDTARLASVMGLEIDQAKLQIYGVKNGINVHMRYFKNDMTFAIRAFAGSGDKALRKSLAAFGAAHLGFSFLRIWPNRISAMFTAADTDNEDMVAAELNEFFAFVSSLGATPCCSTCAENKPAALYDFKSDSLNLCDDCAALVNNDITRINSLRAAHSVKVTGCLPALIASAGAVFLSAYYTSGSAPTLISGVLDGLLGVILAVILTKLLGKKINLAVALISLVLCFAAFFAGTVGWHANYFAKFNKDNAEKQQYIVDYYEELQNGGNPYGDAIAGTDSDLISKYKYLHHCDEDELEHHYMAAKRIIDHQTTSSCVRDFQDLMFSDYGDKMRTGFFKLLFGSAVGLLLGFMIFWKMLLKIDRSGFTLVRLPMATFNPYDVFMGNNNRQ